MRTAVCQLKPQLRSVHATGRFSLRGPDVIRHGGRHRPSMSWPMSLIRMLRKRHRRLPLERFGEPLHGLIATCYLADLSSTTMTLVGAVPTFSLLCVTGALHNTSPGLRVTSVTFPSDVVVLIFPPVMK